MHVSGTMIFWIVIIAIFTVGRIVRAGMELEARKNGFTLGGKRARRGLIDDQMVADGALTQENAMLRGKVKGLEERMAVLERIATDAPARLTAEIEKLRD